jgi:hypothetical protein
MVKSSMISRAKFSLGRLHILTGVEEGQHRGSCATATVRSRKFPSLCLEQLELVQQLAVRTCLRYEVAVPEQRHLLQRRCWSASLDHQ